METKESTKPGNISILLVDDYEPSRVVQTYVIEKGFSDVDVTCSDKPLPDKKMLEFDGIILDQKLVGESGLDVASRLHNINWQIPIMIMTVLKPTDDSFELAYQYVDHIAWKSDPELFNKLLQAFIRQIRRIKAASGANPAHGSVRKSA